MLQLLQINDDAVVTGAVGPSSGHIILGKRLVQPLSQHDGAETNLWMMAVSNPHNAWPKLYFAPKAVNVANRGVERTRFDGHRTAPFETRF